jgi:hypothetical protein
MILKLENIAKNKHQITIDYSVDGYRFHTALWCEGVDLDELEKKIGVVALENICFHIAAFDINKAYSFGPDSVDFGAYQRYCTPAFWDLWTTVNQHIWAQWRYENNKPDYNGPQRLAMEELMSHDALPLLSVPDEANKALVFFGGGKDSLVAAKTCEAIGLPYSAFVYSHSVYGQAKKQHTIVDSALATIHPEKTHRQYVFDSLMDSPVFEIDKSYPYKEIIAGETPASIFASIPLVLSEGYKYVVLAHEKSANKGNMVWEATGEEVNHQWGKSYHAEQLINAYINEHLVKGFSFFSILQPIYDVLIFNTLSQYPAEMKFAHSCNVSKPWCMKCPKCAYVWLNYMAYMPNELVDEVFNGVNLFDLPENNEHFKNMLGLGKHTPFECIGQIEESRLAMHLCKQKGMKGHAMAYYEDFADEENFKAILDTFLSVDLEGHNYPIEFKNNLLRFFSQAEADARARLSSLV